MATETQCVNCGKKLSGRTRPRWVFTRDEQRKPLGLMCSTCSVYRRGASQYDVVDAARSTAEEAQFIAWTGINAMDEVDSDRRMAQVMAWAEHPSLDPRFVSENQRRWLERYAPERQSAIRSAYRQLLAEYADWRGA